MLCRAISRRAVLRRWLATAPSRRLKPPNIQTLDPSLLTASDYIDIAGKKWTSVRLPGFALFRYGFAERAYRPFPPNARGFMYWHQDPSLPPTTAALRFRLTSGPDPALFPSGTDLRLYAGTSLWSIGIPRIATCAIYAPVKDHLIAQRLVDPTLLRALEVAHATIPNPKSGTQALCTLNQPFEIDLSATTYLHVFSKRAIGPIFLTYICFDHRKSVFRPPYTGRILARFELSRLPEHARPPAAHPSLSSASCRFSPPLSPPPLKTNSSHKLFTVDLEKPPKDLRYLKLLVQGDAEP
ncbi:hypothetical protein D9615_005420 [Tricholomella constricta]|uniref:Uncharacterized protein n=1 Tax=Tricholomella constricta TaxID=117010 RepID=A0A8H5HE55_9AGAR|nr:hypothetical protein D9615_005420 [Tricholomella constricta]